MRSELKTTSDKSTVPFVDAGVGFFKYCGDSNYGLRADVRYRWLDAGDVAGSNSFGEPVVKIGLVAALGAKPASAAETAKDSDGDGVPDDADLCPGTAQGVKVDAKGCPLDSDGDGVPDGIDQRSEERRVGEEGVSTGGSRWSQDN